MKMNRILNIIKKNNETFYNYRTSLPITIRRRILLYIFVSFIVALMLMTEMNEFINAVNGIISILLGFSFSVLFYLASIKQEKNKHDSFEAEHREKRLLKLSNELFHNISYFVAISLLLLATALIIIIPNAKGSFLNIYTALFGEVGVYYLLKMGLLISFLIRALFFFLLLETGYTFARIIGRVNFYFEEKIQGK